MLKLIPILVLIFLNACGPDYDAKSDVTGLQFDGVDDYILIEENVLPDSGDYTISIWAKACLLYTSPSPRDKRQSRMPSSA